MLKFLVGNDWCSKELRGHEMLSQWSQCSVLLRLALSGLDLGVVACSLLVEVYIDMSIFLGALSTCYSSLAFSWTAGGGPQTIC